MLLSDLPVEVLLDNLLPLLPTRDLLHLAATNKLFATLCSDDTFWKRRCADEFNFTSSETARTTGWKVLYRGLSHPRVFLWGEKRNGRLGMKNLPTDVGGPGIPYPIELKMPGVRVVSLVAAGMSFHGLDSNGNVYVWGTMDGQGGALNSEGFAVKYKDAQVPHKLILPEPVRAISSGRMHVMALDAKSQIWTFLNWGRPFRLSSSLLDCHAPDTTPLQIEAGWSFCTVLTKSGDVLVWWPYGGELARKIEDNNRALDEQGDKHAYGTDDHRIPCVLSTIESDPFRLPVIPTTLPNLESADISVEERGDQEETRLIKIAAFDNGLVGLTNKGHVLKYGRLNDENSHQSSQWEYLPRFSEGALVRQMPSFENKDVPDSMRITHISAHFQTFVAYSTGSSSIVLMGSAQSTPSSEPEVIPSLQNRSIISVVLGDYHYGALTSTGQLLTWGGYSHGALGLGNPTAIPAGAPGGYRDETTRIQAVNTRWGAPEPPRVDEPAEVTFDHGRKKKGGRKMVFAATAGGWHMGALVIGLEPDEEIEEEEREDTSTPMPGRYPSGSQGGGSQPPPPAPGGVPLPPPGGLGHAGGIGGHLFRVGYAGRGLMRGGAMGARGRGIGRGGLNQHGPTPDADGNN